MLQECLPLPLQRFQLGTHTHTHTCSWGTHTQAKLHVSPRGEQVKGMSPPVSLGDDGWSQLLPGWRRKVRLEQPACPCERLWGAWSHSDHPGQVGSQRGNSPGGTQLPSAPCLWGVGGGWGKGGAGSGVPAANGLRRSKIPREEPCSAWVVRGEAGRAVRGTEHLHSHRCAFSQESTLCTRASLMWWGHRGREQHRVMETCTDGPVQAAK